MKKRFSAMFVSLVLLLGAASAPAAVMTFNSADPTGNITQRTAWLAAIGIAVPQYLIDFESGFTLGQNISGITGLFPAGLVITDSSTAHSVTIRTTGQFGGSSPVGLYGIRHNEQQWLELDFSASPVDYIAFQDIDHTGAVCRITFADNTVTTLSPNIEAGTAAEFFGIFRNDMARDQADPA